MKISAELQRLMTELAEQACNDGIEILVTGGAIKRDEKLLIVVRSMEDDVRAGYTEIPGGCVDHGENLLEGLVRELMEETGLAVTSVVSYISTFDFNGHRGQRCRQFTFSVECGEGEVVLDPKEHSEFFWVSRDDLDQIAAFPMSPEMKGVVEKALG